MKQYKFFQLLLLCIALIAFTVHTWGQSNIVKAEYYIDTDPGFSKATNIAITASPDISAQAFSVDISPLSNGIHYLHARGIDANGHWSLNNTAIFYKGNPLGGGSPTPLTNIVYAEYYLDTDPGFDNATSISVSPGTDITGQAFSVDISALPAGIHYLHSRTKDANGNWSLNNTAIFYKGNPLGGGTPPPLANIAQAEYYIDSDPGFGNATVIPITAGTDISGQSITVDISALPAGIHYLHSRARDANGNWSLNNTTIFYKGNPLGGGTPPLPGNLVKLEYFFDKDPGFGNGIPVSIPGNKTDTVGFAFNANFNGLSMGKHAFYVRAMDDWGLTNVDSFTVAVALPVTLVNFTGQLVNNQVQLQWRTASEQNNDHFEVQHSTDGIQFSSIGNIKGSGTSFIPHDYQFTDVAPAQGNNYYRLKQVDIDGNYTFSSIVDVKLMTGITYTIYPNPAINKVNMVISVDKDQQIKLTLTEPGGKIIETREVKCLFGDNKLEWDISRLAKGMYMICSQNNSGIAVVKFVKE